MTQQSKPPTPPTAGENAAVSHLAAKMAHELNNPLDAVLRFVSLAQRKAKANQYEDLDRHLADAQFGLQRMTEVLRELMDLGRQTNEILGAGASHQKERLPITDLIGRATRTAAALAEQKHVPLIMKSLLPDSAQLPTYDLRVAQILSNLLKNAIEAAPEKTPVRLTVSLQESPSKNHLVTSSACHLVILVEDQGPGIPENLLPQLFTPFLTTKPVGSGTGLGLAISRELALSLSGNLTLQNRPAPATGCLATLTLPLNSN